MPWRHRGWKNERTLLLRMITNLFFREINDNLCFNSRIIKERNVGNIFFCHNGISLLPRRKSMYWKLLVVNPPGTNDNFPIPLCTLTKFPFLARQFFYPFNFFLSLFKFDFIWILSKAIKVEAESFSYNIEGKRLLLNVDSSIRENDSLGNYGSSDFAFVLVTF